MIHTKTLSMKPIDLYLDFYRLNNQFHNGCVVMVFIRIVTNTKNPPSEILDSEGSADFSHVYRYAFFWEVKRHV